MKKQLIPSTNDIKLYGVTDVDGTGAEGAPVTTDNTTKQSGNWLTSLIDNGGSILNGIGSIVGAANSYDRNTTNTTNVNTNSSNSNWNWNGNGTTITACVLGGIALIIVLVILLNRNK